MHVFLTLLCTCGVLEIKIPKIMELGQRVVKHRLVHLLLEFVLEYLINLGEHVGGGAA